MNNAAASQTLLHDEGRWNILHKKAQQVRVARAFALFRERGIEPVLIKGLAAARYYPESKMRDSIDMDIAVGRDDYDIAVGIIEAFAAEGLAIDPHRELRHLDTLEWGDLFENSRLIDIDGDKIRVLRPEDHLRGLIVHWLTDGGSNRDRLWDVYYAVENRPEDFDWDRLLNVVSRNRRRWVICTIGLAKKYLGLNLDDTPIRNEADDLPAWLTQTVEREWTSDSRNWPLELSIHDPKLLLRQMRKRMRPNPIYATVQMEGSFDAPTRVFYQAANLFKRIPSSYRRISHTIKQRWK